MSDRKSDPPARAIWLLQHLCPHSSDALLGDLIERFREGQSVGWFWKQTWIACALGVLRTIQRHWPHLCYAIAGTAMGPLLYGAVTSLPFALHRWGLPWPWSPILLEQSVTAALALAALPVLGLALVLNGTFRWINLLQTGALNLALLTAGHYLQGYLMPWLTRPVPGNPYHRDLVIPLSVLLCFSTFLVAAWLGCRSLVPQRNHRVDLRSA